MLNLIFIWSSRHITYVWIIFYYRHCLWILGNATTLSSSGSIWADLVRDAKDRQCFFNASSDNAISRVIAKKRRDLNRVNVKNNTHISSSNNCGVWVLSLFTTAYYSELVFLFNYCARFLICWYHVYRCIAKAIYIYLEKARPAYNLEWRDLD